MADPKSDMSHHPVEHRVTRLEGMMESVATSLTQLTEDVRRLSQVIGSAGRTNWPLMLTGAIAGISAVAWLNQQTSGANIAIEHHEQWQQMTQNWIIENEKRDNRQDVALSGLQGYDKQLDVRLAAFDDDMSRVESFMNGKAAIVAGNVAQLQAQHESDRRLIDSLAAEIDRLQEQLRQEGKQRDEKILDLYRKQGFAKESK